MVGGLFGVCWGYGWVGPHDEEPVAAEQFLQTRSVGLDGNWKHG